MVASNTRSLQAFVNSAKQNLHLILEESGTILYSSCETLKPGKYYFLGLNPGGSEEGAKSIGEALDGLGFSTENAYLDQDWGSNTRRYGIGGHPLQQNYKFLFEQLGEDPRSVCASNLLFRRSINERCAKYAELVNSCWSVHEAILAIVRPATIITFGRQPFDFINDKCNGATPQESRAGHGNWAWRHSTLETGEKLIGLPHLSRYALRNHQEVVNEIAMLIVHDM